MAINQEISTSSPRVPPTYQHLLCGDNHDIQVNFCKNPACANFGVPARTLQGKTGPSQERDPCYTVVNTARGRVRAIVCKACREKIAIKSNAGVGQEINRMTRYLDTYQVSCPRKGCENHNKPYSAGGKDYSKFGRTRGGVQRMKCKACQTVFPAEQARRIHDTAWTLPIFVFLVNKTPINRSMEMIDELYEPEDGVSPDTIYRNINFIYRRCQDFMTTFDSALARGAYRLGDLVVSTDHQEHFVNWQSRQDRRNTILSAIASADNRSGYVFSVNVNYDADMDADEILADAEKIRDQEQHGAFRKYSRLWLPGDELSPERRLGARAGIVYREGLTERISREYESTELRGDTEDTGFRGKRPAAGMMVHLPYTDYGHFMLLERLLSGARSTLHCLDHESVLRAAYLTAFENKIRKNMSDGMFVSINKDYTVDQRKAIRSSATSAFRKQCRQLLDRHTLGECVRIRMREAMRAAVELGGWRDQWVRHPFPRMDEPEKAMSWLTGRGSLVDERAIDLFLAGTMSGVDNFFMRTRRRLSLLERAITTPSAGYRAWYGYSPYNPAMVEKVLKILQCYLNFCKLGEDGLTPAMRLGIANRRYRTREIINLSLGDKVALAA